MKKNNTRKNFALTAALLVTGAVFAGNAVNPDALELCPVPRPAEMSADADKPVELVKVEVTLAKAADRAAAIGWLEAHFAEWFGAAAPTVTAGMRLTYTPLPEGDEAYVVQADATGVRLHARTLAGVRWAAYTLRQLASAKRGTMTTTGYTLPTLKIADKPLLGFRAVHLCWIPPVTATQIERAIRLAALMKFNYAIIEPWGMYKSEKNPWWCWPDAKMTKAEIRRLTAIGKDLGITLIPQINVYGHATSARSCSVKHAILDLQPQYEPLFEPGGWNWCLTNPETQRVLRELIAEMHEDFGNPPYFHLGCDEAQPPMCSECRKVRYGDLVCKHIAGLADFVAKRGAKAMIWHDMLLEAGDQRWNGFVKSGSKDTARLADLLPKDVIICDWQYSYGDMKETRKDWPTFAYFKEKGFPVCGCPWMNYNAMKPMADYLAEIGGFGYIQTTWHHLRGSDWRHMYCYGSAAAWGTEMVKWTPMFDIPFGNALRMVGHDMKVTDPKDTGYLNYQIPPAWWVDNN